MTRKLSKRSGSMVSSKQNLASIGGPEATYIEENYILSKKSPKKSPKAGRNMMQRTHNDSSSSFKILGVMSHTSFSKIN